MKKVKEINEYGQNISVKNANLWYGDFQALKNINIEIGGDLCGFIYYKKYAKSRKKYL